MALWPSRSASAIACDINALPMPALFSDGSTASGPSSSAGRPPSPAATSHSRTVPTTAPSRIARDEGQAFRRPPAAAQLLRRFLASASSPWRGRAALRARRHRQSDFGDDGERHGILPSDFNELPFAATLCEQQNLFTSEPEAGENRRLPGDLTRRSPVRSRRIGAARSR